MSGRVVGAVGAESCSLKNGGPSNVKIELLSPSGDLISSVLTSSVGSYSFNNIVPGWEFYYFPVRRSKCLYTACYILFL